MHIRNGGRRYRFGVFEADERTGELHRQGRRLALQGQPLDVLLLLLTRPGQLVTRAEFREHLWPEGTFVDFDHSLNTAMAKIREALGDSASSPRYVETLARRGYRFIAPVEVIEDRWPGVGGAPTPGSQTPPENRWPGVGGVPTPGSETALPEAPSPSSTLLTRPDELPPASAPLVRKLFLLVQVMYLCFYIAGLARLGHIEEAVRPMASHTLWAVVLVLITAVAGIPIRLYLISAAGFNTPGLRPRFLRIFPVTFLLDEVWALAPLLLAPQIGLGLALGATAALLYVPFAQRSLVLMGAAEA